jgi:hypothetical protein
MTAMLRYGRKKPENWQWVIVCAIWGITPRQAPSHLAGVITEYLQILMMHPILKRIAKLELLPVNHL